MWGTNENSSGTGGIMYLFILIVIIWLIFGGSFGNTTVAADCNRVSTCEVEKQTIINTATTQNLINEQNEKTRDQLTSLFIQGQSEKLFDLKLNAQTTAILNGQALAAKDAEIAQLKGQNYTDAKFGYVERQLHDISCNTPQRPPYYAQGFVTTGQPIPTSFGC